MANPFSARVENVEARLKSADNGCLVVSVEPRIIVSNQTKPDPILLDMTTELQPRSRGRPRRLFSGNWAPVLGHLTKRHRAPFGTEDLKAAVLEIGTPLIAKNLRSQLDTYVRKELLQRVSDGQFRMTAKGLSELQRVLGEEAANSNG